jgi:replicative DNA helicase
MHVLDVRAHHAAKGVVAFGGGAVEATAERGDLPVGAVAVFGAAPLDDAEQPLQRAQPELRPGDRIAVPRSYPTDSLAEPWDPDRLVLLAHLMGDGCYASRQPLHYTSASEANLRAVEQAAKNAFDVTGKRVKQSNWQHLYLSAGANRWNPNPITEWLRGLGIHGQRSKEKFIPDEVLRLPPAQVALFLQHLWATDGSVRVRGPGRGPKASIYYASSSEKLARQVQYLLSRLEIHSRLKTVHKPGYGPGYHVVVYGATDQKRFATVIGGFGEKAAKIADVERALVNVVPNTNVDTIPVAVWELVKARMKELGITQRRMQQMRGVTYGGTSHFRFAPSRAMLEGYAALLDDPALKEIASSDVHWDTVVSIEPDGSEDVYDMTVPGSHSFVANGIICQNSLEQDSDLVMLLYRDEVYNPDSEAKGEAEVIVAKHRNGPTGVVRLAFMNQYTKFASIAKGPGF